MIVDELIGILGYEIKGEQNLSKFQRGIDNASKSISMMGVAVGTFVGNIAAQAFTRLGSAIGSIPGDVIKVSAQFEGFEAALTTIEGSADKASKSMDWVAKFARETPYDVAGVTDAFIKLKTYGIDPIADDALRTLGDAASAMNKPLNQAVEALADATTFQFERLREFGITTQQKGNQVTFSFQKDGKQVQETVKKSGEAVRKWLLENLGNRFNGAMLRQSKTWDGMISNLGDSWVDFQRRIGRGGFFDTVKGHLGDLLDYIGKLDEDGTLERWSKSLSSGLTWAVSKAKGHIEDLQFVAEKVSTWFKSNSEWWGPVKAGLVALAAYTFPKTFALLVLEDFIKWWQGKGSVIGDLAASIQELTGIDAGKVDDVLASLALGGAALLIAVGPTKAMGAAIRGLASALGLLGGGAAAKGLENLKGAKAPNGTGSDGLANKGAPVGFFGGVATWLKGLGLNAAIASIPSLLSETPGETFEDQVRNQAKSKAALRRLFGMGGDNSGHPYMQDNGDGGRGASLDAFLNFKGNMAKMGGAVTAVVNDSSDRSINVKATATVSVTEVNQAAAAAGRETENAVRSALSSKPRLNKGMY